MCLTRPYADIFAYGDIALLILELCPLADLTHLSHCGTKMRDLVRRRLLSHTRTTLADFLTIAQQHEMFDLLLQTYSGINGSVGGAIARPNYRVGTTDGPQDLNISVPLGRRDAWNAFWLQQGAAVGRARDVRVDLAETIQSVTVYEMPNPTGAMRNIVLTESRTASILQPLLSSQWTHQMTVFLGTKIVVVYPELLASGRSLPAYAERNPQQAGWTRFYHRGWWHYAGAHHIPGIDRDCGRLCSFLWLRTAGFVGIGEVSWGGRDNLFDRHGTMQVNGMRNERLRWRLDNVCMSETCRNNGNSFRL
ncbi:hypothetical protein C8J57DRAFT_1496890 [Mycena rebaudengoi]|nr:hypothetical protein C8J57DRAFT_1496890 [Mycena rebaudengoi]